MLHFGNLANFEDFYFPLQKAATNQFVKTGAIVAGESLQSAAAPSV